MDKPVVCFTAVYLKGKHGYVGFVEELPGVNSHGQTIEQARESLRRLALLIFDRDCTRSEALLKGKDVVRERLQVPILSS